MAIKLRPDGKFDVRVSIVVHGKLVEKRQRGLNSKGEARKVENDLKGELFVLKQKGWQKTLTWNEALSDYYSLVEKKSAFSTLSSTKSILELHTSLWKERPVDSFSSVEIERHIESALTDKSMATKNKLLQYIRGVFRRQIEFGKISKNPCVGLTYGRAPEKKLIAMTREEIELLLKEAFLQNHPWYGIWRVMYELGLRSGEGLALRWSDINFIEGTASVGHSFCSKSKTIGPTKNRKVRTLPLNHSLVEFLKQLKLKTEYSEFVLPQYLEWKRGEAAETLRAFQLELNIRLTNFHSLRASFITHLLLRGIPITKVQSLVGHADLKTTQKYVRLAGSDLKGATDVLSLDLKESKVDRSSP